MLVQDLKDPDPDIFSKRLRVSFRNSNLNIKEIPDLSILDLDPELIY